MELMWVIFLMTYQLVLVVAALSSFCPSSTISMHPPPALTMVVVKLSWGVTASVVNINVFKMLTLDRNKVIMDIRIMIKLTVLR